MKFARIALVALSFGLIVEPVVLQHSDVAYAATKRKKSSKRVYTKAQRADIHKRATAICRKQYHTTTQVQVIYRQDGQIRILCWGN